MVLPQNLYVLRGLLDEVRRLAIVLPPLPSDIAEVFVAVEDARAAALASGNTQAASQLASVARCLHVSSRNPRGAESLLDEACAHLEDVCSKLAGSE